LRTHHVERRIVECDPPVGGRQSADPDLCCRRCRFHLSLLEQDDRKQARVDGAKGRLPRASRGASRRMLSSDGYVPLDEIAGAESIGRWYGSRPSREDCGVRRAQRVAEIVQCGEGIGLLRLAIESLSERRRSTTALRVQVALRGEPAYRALFGTGRTWWAHFEFTA
jgi:hypothetical protein